MLKLNDKKAVLILLCALSVLFFMFRGHLGYFFIDIPREVYIPYAVNAGGVLYKDIFNVYAPLGYQLNAFITSVFGNGLDVFYTAGLINAALIIETLYLISRMFLSVKLSFLLCLFVSGACIFSNSAANYIFPYSYSMVYALSAFLPALWAVLSFIKTDNKKYLYFSFAAFGASLSFKYEFIFFAAVLLYFFFKKADWKEKALCAACFSVFPFVSALNLCLSGVNFEDIKTAVNYMLMLSKTESVKTLYTFLGFIPSIPFAKILFLNLIYSAAAVLIFSAPVFLKSRFEHLTGLKKILFNIVNAALICVIFLSAFKIFSSKGVFLFSWIGLGACVLCAVFFIKNGLKIETKDKLYAVLLISSCLAAAKSIFNISFNTYGNYYLPLLILCLTAFAVLKLPLPLRERAGVRGYDSGRGNVLSFVNYSLEKYISCIFLFLFCIYTLTNYKGALEFHNARINTEKGIILTQDIYAGVINSVCSYIKNNTGADDRVLVMPDGAFINYLTERKSDNKYYSLMPPNTEIFQQDKIISDLKKNPPEYIVIQPMMYKDYGVSSFCRSFGSEICSYIQENYSKEIVFTDEKSKFNMSVWKNRQADKKIRNYPLTHAG